jgi:drug/metabolite transporter (DMT)-like permease
VAALRESSVVIAAVLGTLVLHEPFGRLRVVASSLVAAGIVALNLPA